MPPPIDFLLSTFGEGAGGSLLGTTPPIGGAWGSTYGASDIGTGGSGLAFKTGNGVGTICIVDNADAPSSARYACSWRSTVAGTFIGFPQIGRTFRKTSNLDYCLAIHDINLAQLLLYDVVGGTFNLLHTETGVAAGLHHFVATLDGTNFSITIDGGATIGPFTTANTAAGTTGLWAAGANQTLANGAQWVNVEDSYL